MDKEVLKKYFDEKSLLNSIGHAYLFSNTTYENIKDIIEYICYVHLFKNNIEIENNPDIYIIEPEKKVIKKEKILELEKELSKTSQINTCKLYIIKECEKLNLAAANCLLKTLEEPGKNIYAFLLTENKDFVIPTIISRCQILQCEVLTKKLNDDLIETSISFINFLEKNMTKSIAYNSIDLYKNLNKDELEKVLNFIELFYKDCLNKNYGMNLEYFINYEEEINNIIKMNTGKKIIKKIQILNDNINLLKYNLNGNLFVDKFLIEFGRISND